MNKINSFCPSFISCQIQHILQMSTPKAVWKRLLQGGLNIAKIQYIQLSNDPIEQLQIVNFNTAKKSIFKPETPVFCKTPKANFFVSKQQIRACCVNVQFSLLTFNLSYHFETAVGRRLLQYSFWIFAQGLYNLVHHRFNPKGTYFKRFGICLHVYLH